MMQLSCKLETLLEQAKDGLPIAPSDEVQLVSYLEHPEEEETLYTILHILSRLVQYGTACDKNLVSVLRPFLQWRANEPKYELVKQTELLQEWPGERIRWLMVRMLGCRIVDQVSFDSIILMLESELSDLVCLAIYSSLGHYGVKYKTLSGRCAALLLDRLEKHRHDPEQLLEWRSAYDGLLTLLAVPASEWPDPDETTPDNVDWGLINQATAIANGP